MSSPERQLLRIGVGLLATLVGGTIALAISTGDFIAAIQLVLSVIMVSIICTLGVSLIIWLPLFWLVGFIVLAIIESFGYLPRSQPTPAIQRDIRAITSYIAQSRSHGASDHQIMVRLREQGWSNDEIDRAFQTFSNPSNS